MSTPSRRIVVGVDGSSASRDAVRWAAATAAVHHLDLHIAHALQLAELYYGGSMAGTGDLVDVVRQDAERVVEKAVAVARSVREDLAISTDCPVESPGSLLIGLSRDARMVVVGHTGRGGFAGMLRRELVRDRPRHALLDWSATAQLLVVGSRGRGGIRGMLLGSTSQSLVQHAQCPVLVVRAL
jgi:nucleotide-binding universal stress UspA family protein